MRASHLAAVSSSVGAMPSAADQQQQQQQHSLATHGSVQGVQSKAPAPRSSAIRRRRATALDNDTTAIENDNDEDEKDRDNDDGDKDSSSRIRLTANEYRLLREQEQRFRNLIEQQQSRLISENSASFFADLIPMASQ